MLGIIHIGTEKTGSTFLQKFVRNNADMLRDSGIATPSSTGPLNDRELATYAMKPHLIDDHVQELGIVEHSAREQWRDEFRSQFLEECQALKNDHDALLLSSEHFHSRLVAQEDVSSLFDLLSEVCNEFKVIVYLRRQDRMAASYASTYFKSGQGGGLEGFRKHLEGLVVDGPYFDYWHLLSTWAKVFGNESIAPRLYSRAQLFHNDLLSDFAHAIELPMDSLPAAQLKRDNVSLSNSAVDSLSAFTRHFPIDSGDTDCVRNQQLRARFIAHLEDELPGQLNVFTRAEAEQFYARFKEQNNRTARQWLDSHALFDEDFSSYPEHIEEQSSEADQVRVLLNFFQREMQAVLQQAQQEIAAETSATQEFVS